MMSAIALVVLSQVGLCGAGRTCQVGGIKYQDTLHYSGGTYSPACGANTKGQVMYSSQAPSPGLYKCDGSWAPIGGAATITSTGDAGTPLMYLIDGGVGPAPSGTNNELRYVVSGGLGYLAFPRLGAGTNATDGTSTWLYGGNNANEIGLKVGNGGSIYLSGTGIYNTGGQQFLFSAGSAGAAPYAFATEPGTGVFKPATGALGFSGNNTQFGSWNSADGLRIFGVATGSLNACSTSLAGTIQFDSTLGRFVVCPASSGSSTPLIRYQGSLQYGSDTVQGNQENNASFYCGTGTCPESLDWLGTYTLPAGRTAIGQVDIDCGIGGIGVAGTGSGTPSITLRDVTGAANVNSCNFSPASCTATSYTCKITGAMPSLNTKLTLRFSKGACTTAPTNLFCNVRFE